jgi:6-phosphogluconolactonase
MKDYNGFIGSYTRKESKGIRRFRFNEEEFQMEDFYEVHDPTYLSLSKDETILYSSMRDKGDHGVLSMDLQRGVVDKVLFTNENTPCHVSTFENHLLASNYHEGKLDLYETEEGMVKRRLESIRHEGRGPMEKRQDASHVHFAMKNPHNEDILVCDLGTDKVYIYRLEDKELNKVGDILLPPGSGPRHLSFLPKAKFLYILSELSAEVFVYDFRDGEYTLKQVQKTLPEDFHGENTGAAIRITPDNRFLYVSNRGHNSLTSFRIKDNHLLEKIETVSSEGDHPRDFNISPDGEFLLLANMISNNLVLYKIDRDTGRLSLLRKDLPTPEPVSIVFMK